MNDNNPQPRLTMQRLNERINTLEEKLEIGMNIALALKLSGLTEDEVRSTLHIKSDIDLTADTVLAGLIRHAQNTGQTLGVIVRDQNKLARDVTSATQAHERLTNTVNHLDAAVQEDHDVLNASVLPRLHQLEKLLADNLDALQSGATGGRKSFIQELRDRRVSDDDIRRALVILDDGNELTLTDEQLFYELYSAHTLLCSRVDEHETRLTQVEQTVENIDDGHIPVWGWVGALVAFVVVWLLVWLLPYGVSGTVRNDDGKAIGQFTGGWHSGWLGVGLGLVAAGFVLLLTKGSGHRRSTTTTSESETTQSSRTGRVSALRHGVAQYRARRTVQQSANDTEAPAPESVS